MADINKVWLSGRAVTQPVLTKLPPATPFATFILQINERYLDRSGVPCFKENLVRIESLGRSAGLTMERVQEGGRYHVEGYLRVDRDGGNPEECKIRTFAIYREESDEARFYQEGLQQALKIVEESRDRQAAIGRLKDLLKTG